MIKVEVEKMNPQLVWNREWNGLNLIGGGGGVVVRERNNVSSGYCHKEHKACIWWVDRYLKDCLCNLSDEISFGFGLISLFAWAVAEVPQIITNFRTKSSHGVSILFLLTWVFGYLLSDIFNLVGCLLEPATLPTQYYTALLYTVSTVVLLLQSLYYDHFYWGHSKTLLQEEEDEPKRPLNPKKEEDEDDTECGGGGGIGIGMAIPRTSSRPRPTRDCYYFTSARSMAGSSTPPFRSYLSRRVAKSGPSTVALGQQDDDHSSSEDEHHPSSFQPTAAARPMPIPRSTAQRVLVAAASLNLPFHGNARLTRTNLLQDASEHSMFGQWLGWLMAAIYMGGRFPQIILNIKRGSVEGLNPLMFIFALVANVSYVASILVRSTEWKKIKANMPWLLDAVVCVALDLFIILQYFYYKYMLKKGISCANDEDEDEKRISVEAEQRKPN